MTRLTIPGLGLAAAAILALGGCVSGGGVGASLLGGDEPEERAAMPSDTYDNCLGGGVGGVNFLSSGSEARGVTLGMSECDLITVLGDPSQVTPGAIPGARRVVHMVYPNPDGTGTEYVFVDNALREMNRVETVAPPPGEGPAL